MGILRAGALPGLHMQPTAQVFDGSLRFNGTNHHLSRSFGSGNRRTWTWSAWVKRHKFGATNYGLFSFYGGSGNGSFIRFSDDSGGDTLRFYSDTNTRSIVSSAQFRDPSAWYNIVISVDTTKKQDYERVRRYVNGVRQYDNASNTWPTENEELLFNQSGNHYLGRVQASAYGPVSMSNVNFIDGLALGPEYFGFTDPLTGTWRPKKFRAVGTTVNDGTDWSANFSGNGGTQPSTAFDGDGPRQDGYVHSGSELVVNFDPPLSGHIIVYGGTGAGSHNSVTTDTFTLSDGSVLSSQEKYDVAPYFNPLDFGEKKNITSLTCSAGYTLYAVEVDGVFLKDSTTENLDFGTNGFYLPMDNEDDFEIDKSGKGNNWTKNNFSGTSIDPDVLKDSPSGAIFGGRAQTGITTTSSTPGNYCTYNPLDNHGNTLSNGNLVATDTGGDWHATFGTIPSSDGKHYFEITPTTLTTTCAIGVYVGNGRTDFDGTKYPYDANTYMIHQNGYIYHAASTASYQTTYSANDTVGVAVDSKNRKVWISVNGSFVSGENPTTGVGGLQSVGGVGAMPDGEIYPVISLRSAVAAANFGQKPFKYAPPQGYLPLNSATVRPNKVVPRPDQYVGITTYTGTNESVQKIKTEFEADFVWLKSRSGAYNNALFDTVRGATKKLVTNSTAAESTDSEGVKTFFDDGVTVGNSNEFGADPRSYIMWHWKAGGRKNTFNVDDVGYASAAAAGLTAGTITPVGASVGTKQGFSIVKFQGTGATATFSHGLEQAPDFMICKSNASGPDWGIYHRSAGKNKILYFTTAKAASSTTAWDDTHPTDSLVYLGANGTTNQGGADSPMIYYIWHNVPGLQKFGSYEGNGSTDGPFVELGFKPALIIIKNIDSTGTSRNWAFVDSTRSFANVANHTLAANLASAESAYGTGASVFGANNKIDLLSNGFKPRENAIFHNTDGENYIYAAWAEAPASNLFGGQSTGR